MLFRSNVSNVRERGEAWVAGRVSSARAELRPGAFDLRGSHAARRAPGAAEGTALVRYKERQIVVTQGAFREDEGMDACVWERLSVCVCVRVCARWQISRVDCAWGWMKGRFRRVFARSGGLVRLRRVQMLCLFLIFRAHALSVCLRVCACLTLALCWQLWSVCRSLQCSYQGS